MRLPTHGVLALVGMLVFAGPSLAEGPSDRGAEEQAPRGTEGQANREAEEQADRVAEEQARREAEEQAEREAEEQADGVAEEDTDRETEAWARGEAEAGEKARAEAEMGAGPRGPNGDPVGPSSVPDAVTGPPDETEGVGLVGWPFRFMCGFGVLALLGAGGSLVYTAVLAKPVASDAAAATPAPTLPPPGSPIDGPPALPAGEAPEPPGRPTVAGRPPLMERYDHSPEAPADEPKRRSPAEAFDALKAAVNRSATEISDLWDFTQKVKIQLLQAAEVQRMEGMLPLLDSMLQIHQILFVRLRAAGANEGDASEFLASLLETVEEELSRHGAEIVKPELGEAFDLHTMDCTKAVERQSLEDAPSTIAAVNRCGLRYRPTDGGRERLVGKAQVEVFAK